LLHELTNPDARVELDLAAGKVFIVNLSSSNKKVAPGTLLAMFGSKEGQISQSVGEGSWPYRLTPRTKIWDMNTKERKTLADFVLQSEAKVAASAVVVVGSISRVAFENLCVESLNYLCASSR
jgi:hypothetical protein